jgi:hypothetical protein
LHLAGRLAGNRNPDPKAATAVLDLTPLAHRCYLAETERSARTRRRDLPRAPSDLARRALAVARRLIVRLGVRAARSA